MTYPNQTIYNRYPPERGANRTPVIAVLHRLFWRWKMRRQIRKLLSYDAERLADLGITKSDVENALNGDANPSVYLQCKARENRRGNKLGA